MVPQTISHQMPPITIPQFFNGRSVFVTGGTGFMGKVLLSKLLRSCSGLDKLYVLIRSRRGKTAAARLKEMLNSPLFETVSDSEFDKVVPVEGDITELRLGLSAEDYTTITSNTSIVFHVAATVRFNDSLTSAILMNTRGTREVVNLCLHMKQLVALLHVSTSYCNCERTIVEEVVYPAPVDWREAIQIVETLDPAVVNTFSKKYMGDKPNTYTFSKCLAEHIVWDHRHQLPIIIFRPSIVVSTWKDPVPGWLDNLNGPVAMMMGAGTGVLRVCMADRDVVPDYMPVDIAIRALIIAVYLKGTSTIQEPEESVINCATTSSSISNNQMFKIGMDMVEKLPLTETLWSPSEDTTTSITYFTVKSWFAHLLPALFVDLFLRITGREPRLVNMQRKIFVAITALSYFTCREWKFKNEKFMRLLTYILPEDMEDFDFEFRNVDPREYFEKCIRGARIYLLNDPIENIPNGKKRARRLYWADKILNTFLVLFAVWLFDLPRRLRMLWSSHLDQYFLND